MTPCRSVLHTLRCQKLGGHSGPHRSGLTVWSDALPPRPRAWAIDLAPDGTINGI